jgi:hypothetical protein
VTNASTDAVSADGEGKRCFVHGDSLSQHTNVRGPRGLMVHEFTQSQLCRTLA